MIFVILLCMRGEKDSMFWFDDLKGFYYVKSGYRLVEKLAQIGRVGSTTSSKWWKIIWSLGVRNKVKHFLWKGCRNYLAWCLNSNSREMKVGAECQRCCLDIESLSHALIVIGHGNFG